MRASAPRAVKPRGPRKAPRRYPEHDLQINVVRMVRLCLFAPAKVWWVPNGTNMSKGAAGRARAMGLLSGVADLHFAWEGGGYGVIEMKRPDGTGRLDAEQVVFRDDMQRMGHRWGIAASVEEVLDLLQGWGVPMRRIDVKGWRQANSGTTPRCGIGE